MDSKKKWGGERAGAGRKPSLIQKYRITINVPLKYTAEIRAKFDKIVKAYEQRCEREL